MTFTSLTFLIFLPLVFIAYWTVGRRSTQNVLLVFASYVFYCWWDYRFCALMLASSLVDYAIGWRIANTQPPSVRKCLLAMSLLSNLGLLATLKYFNFFLDNFALLASGFGWQINTGTIEIILPVGISFYTFQTLSYTIDIYRRQIQPTTNLVDYLAFVSFFPQLVAGPIERASRLLPQFATARSFSYSDASDGCRQVLWGFFKKLIIADHLSTVVDPVYASPGNWTGPELVFCTICFAFQIYCDFSAYSDIAIGTAKLFGINLMRNFAYPYFSQSISEFWRRWHISLSSWFRDYVYVPLGGNRTGVLRNKINILATFLISGFWHGAAWNFILWGGINGVATAAAGSDQTSNEAIPGGDTLIPRVSTLRRILSTFTIVCLCWIFFRAESFSDALLILQKIFIDLLNPAAYAKCLASLTGAREKAILVISGLLIVEWLQRRNPHPLHIDAYPRIARWLVYTLLLWGILDGVKHSQEFIYFTF